MRTDAVSPESVHAERSQKIPLIIITLAFSTMLDSFLKELPWVPAYVRPVGFFILAPIVVIGTFLIIPYLNKRLAIVTPRATSKLVFGLAVTITMVQAGIWVSMYYTVEIVGQSSIKSSALLLEDVVLVSSAFVFGLLGVRLLRWYRRTRNRLVLTLTFQQFVAAAFVVLHILPDFLSSPTPRIITDGFAALLITAFWSVTPATAMMFRAYYGKVWKRHLLPYLLGPPIVTVFLVSNRLGVIWDIYPLTFLIFGFILANIAWPLSFMRVSHALENATAKEYFRGLGYSYVLWTFASCGIGLRLLLAYPLSGFASLAVLLPASCLSFATFTSAASYFSISEDVRKQIHQSAGLMTSIGEAQSIMLTEQQVSDFYDRFTGLAKASGAVEASALTKDDIYSYAKTLKRIQSQTVGDHV